MGQKIAYSQQSSCRRSCPPCSTYAADIALRRNPELLHEALADFRQPGLVPLDGRVVAGPPGQFQGRLVAGVGVGRLLRGAAAVVPLVVSRPGIGVALVQTRVVRIEAVVDVLQVQLQRRTQHLLQFRVAGPAPGMNELVEELALHVVVPRVMEIDAALAEEAGVERLATEAGRRIGLGERLIGFGDLPCQAGAGLRLDAVMPAVDRAAEHRPPAQERHAPAHAGVGEDPFPEDAVGDGVERRPPGR